MAESAFVQKIKLIPKAACIAAGLASSIFLAIWIFLPTAKEFSSGSMKCNTAVALIAASLSLWFLQDDPQDTTKRRLRIGYSFAMITLLVGVLTICQYLFGFNLGIDDILTADFASSESSLFPGRMSPIAAACFILMGLGLLVINTWPNKKLHLASVFLIPLFFLSFLALLGYVYSESMFYKVGPFIRISWQTASCCFILAIGILHARPKSGPIHVLTSEGLGGMTARGLFPVVMIVPVFMGSAWLYARRIDAVNRELGVSLFVIAVIIIIWAVIVVISKRLDRLEAEGKSLSEREKIIRERFMEVLNHSPLIVWALDKFGNYTLSEGKALDHLGFKSAEVVGRNHFAFYKNEPKAIEYAKRALDGETFTAEAEIAGRSYTTNYVPTRDSEGHIQGMSAVSTDITDLKNAQSDILIERENLRNLFTQSPEMLCILSGPDHVFEFLNEAHVHSLGFNAVGKKCRDIQPEAVEVHEILDLVFQTGKTAHLQELSIRVGEKVRYFDLTFAAKKDGSGGINGVMILGMDVSHQIAARMALSESEAKFRTIADAMPQMVWSTLPDGYHDYYNKRWYEFTGTLEGSTDGEGWNDLFHPDDQARAWSVWRESLETGKPYEIEYRLKHRSGEYRWTLGRALPVKNEGGEITRWMGTCTDIHDQKLAAEELQCAKEEAEKASHLKSAFLANMSHEIRTPLGAMMGFADLLGDPGINSAERANYIDILHRNGEQLGRVINDILDLSKVETGHVNFEYLRVSPLQMAHEVVSLMGVVAKEKGIALSFEDDGSTPEEIVTDSTRTKQVLMNLVSNALKFTKVGSVKITLSGYEGKDGAKCCAFEVIDSGIGIPEASIERLFKMFTQADNSMTRKYGGTGLGLALSRSLARAMGGNVRLVKTEPDRGSTFHFSIESQEDLLPSTDENEPIVTKHADPNFGPDTLKNIRVLLVEDSPDNQQLIWHYLSKYGAHIDIADNGLEGVTKALVGKHDLILMDLQMPVMDGYTAVGKLRAKGYQKPIVALTAHAMSDVRKKCQDVGCTDHLPKPINPKEMVDTILRLTRLT